MYMGFPRQEYWSGLPFPSPEVTTQRSNPCLLHSGGFFTTEPLGGCLSKRQRQLGLIRFLKWYNAVQEIRC